MPFIASNFVLNFNRRQPHKNIPPQAEALVTSKRFLLSAIFANLLSNEEKVVLRLKFPLPPWDKELSPQLTKMSRVIRDYP